MRIKTFLENAFNDMKESAKAQHEVDKANFAAAKAESKANWEEAKAISKTYRSSQKTTVNTNNRIVSTNMTEP